MSHPDAELLAGVALDEEPDAALGAHLGSCRSCRGVVAELRYVADAARAAAPLVPPPERVWDAVRTDVARGRLRVVPDAASSRGVPSARPRREAGVPRRQVFGWLAAAAASGVVVGGGATWLATRPAAPPVVSPLASVQLATLDTREVLGEADVLPDTQGVRLTVRTQPLDARDGYLEVWLINRDLARMVSVGVVPPGSTELSFPIARELIEQGYVVVDISREAFDDRPEHSGDSIVRGELPL